MYVIRLLISLRRHSLPLHKWHQSRVTLCSQMSYLWHSLHLRDGMTAISVCLGSSIRMRNGKMILAVIEAAARQKRLDLSKLSVEFSVLLFQNHVFIRAPSLSFSIWIEEIDPAFRALLCRAPVAVIRCNLRPSSSYGLELLQTDVFCFAPRSRVARNELANVACRTLIGIAAIAHSLSNSCPGSLIS